MLSKKNRLTKRGSFAYVYKKGSVYSDKLLRLFCVKSNSLKIGFSVSNKLGKAVVRNKIKRRLRAIVRQYIKDLNDVQAVIVAKTDIKDADYALMNQSVKKAFIKAGLFK